MCFKAESVIRADDETKQEFEEQAGTSWFVDIVIIVQFNCELTVLFLDEFFHDP